MCSHLFSYVKNKLEIKKENVNKTVAINKIYDILKLRIESDFKMRKEDKNEVDEISFSKIFLIKKGCLHYVFSYSVRYYGKCYTFYNEF